MVNLFVDAVEFVVSRKKPILKAYGSRWTQAAALKVHAGDPTTTMPLIPHDFPVPPANKSLWQWDTWDLRRLTGETVTINGQFVRFGLFAPKVDSTGAELVDSWVNRNNASFIGWQTSPTGNGTDWETRGPVIAAGANKRNWQWSGCAVLRSGRESEGLVDLFFTSVGTAPASVPCHTSGRIVEDANGVLQLEGFDVCTDMFEADGVHYANFSEDAYWDFRDPHVFVNPHDGRVYALFEGNVPGVRGQFTLHDADVGSVPPGYVSSPGAQYGAAAIGIARLKDGAYEAGQFGRENWELMPALVTALGVNDQTERPHCVFKDGLTYLFTISHNSTYTGNSTGPDGVYGFVSRDGIFGPYEPLNSSGLVLGNPPDSPLETYSHFVDTQGYVQSFINYVADPANLPADRYQAAPGGSAPYRIGGCMAPTVRLSLEGNSTFLIEAHDYGQVFAVDDVTLVTPTAITTPAPQQPEASAFV